MEKPQVDDKHEARGSDWKPPTLEQTIEKLKANKYQYASAGDVRRLVEEVERLLNALNALRDSLVIHGAVVDSRAGQSNLS